jgi:hypothetical protein
MAYRGSQSTTGTASAVEGESGSGAASLAGYEYQIDVSVWLALDLILVSRQAQELLLEPASQEDLEADLSDPEPGRLVNQVPMSGYTLVVQAKRRGGNAWTPKTLKSLLEHGSDQRVCASKRLEDPDYRYLLVTSAGVNADAQKLSRRRPGMWPGQSALPRVIADGLGHDISGRLSVIANQDDERLRGDIDRLLTESCRVPNARLEACRIKLREAARARIACVGGGRWGRQELEDIIRKHDGYLASSPELENYVRPNNWDELRSQMARRSSAILVGQSGTGKTLTTQMLYDELRKELPGLTRVLIRQGPSQLRDDTTPSPVLYDIEDPWGRFDFDRNSRPWNDQLGRFLAAARPDAMIIATSRLDVARESGAFDTVKNWVVRLEAENYGEDQRHRLYTSRIESLPRELQALTRTFETEVLDKLATPLEIQKFFDAMRTQDPQDASNDFLIVREAIRRAHRDSIEQTVIEQIETRGDISAATILWAFMEAGNKVTRSILRTIEDGLCDMDTAMDAGISSFVDFFVAARNFRQSDDGVLTYYHPRVEAGITRAIEKYRQPVRQTLRQLIDFLVSMQSPDSELGTEAAARILGRVADPFAIKASQSATAKIDDWLEARLAEGGKEFESNLKLAATAGSAASNGAEIARFLLHCDVDEITDVNLWEAPERTFDWYCGRAASISTKPLLEIFIRTVLTRDHFHYPASFAEYLARLSPGLEAAFMDAARTVVDDSYIDSDEAIAYGALQDFDGFEAVVDLAVGVLRLTEDDLRERAETRLDVINNVYEDDYADDVEANLRGHTADKFLKAYVKCARNNKKQAHLAIHRHIDWIRPLWLQQIIECARQDGIDEDEFAAAFKVGYGTRDEEALWLALSNRWNPQYSLELAARIRDGASTSAVEHAALACILKNDSQTCFALLADLVNDGAIERLVHIGRGIAYLCRSCTNDGDNHRAVAEAAAVQLPYPYDEICAAETALKDEKAPVLSQTARQVLEGIDDASGLVRSLRLQLDESLAFSVEDDVRWALEASDDPQTSVFAVEAAIRHGMSREVEAALDHRFAHVVARALTSIASTLETPLPAHLLAFVTHRGSPVRLALVAALTARVHPSYQQTLVQLAEDKWSTHYPDGEQPIARVAIAGLIELDMLKDNEGIKLFGSAIMSSDREVLNAICLLLARSSANMQRQILDLAVRLDHEGVQSAATAALLSAHESIDQQLIDGITAEQIASCHERVASGLALLLGARGTPSLVLVKAKELATNTERRVLLLLVACMLNDRTPTVAREIAQMVSADREVVDWALGCRTTTIHEDLIANLGDPTICAEVIQYMI